MELICGFEPPVLSQSDHIPAQSRKGDGQSAAVQYAVPTENGRYAIGVKLRVHSLHIVVVQYNVLLHCVYAKGAQIRLQLKILLHVAVDGKDGHRAVLALHSRPVQNGNAFVVHTMRVGKSVRPNGLTVCKY